VSFKSGTHHTWTEGELKQFEDKWPVGSSLLLFTGQRAGDVVRMRRQDIQNGELYVIQEKTGAELYLPVAPELELAMKAYPAKGMTLIGAETILRSAAPACCMTLRLQPSAQHTVVRRPRLRWPGPSAAATSLQFPNPAWQRM
jgi:integrase